MIFWWLAYIMRIKDIVTYISNWIHINVKTNRVQNKRTANERPGHDVFGNILFMHVIFDRVWYDLTKLWTYKYWKAAPFKRLMPSIYVWNKIKTFYGAFCGKKDIILAGERVITIYKSESEYNLDRFNINVSWKRLH